VYARRVNGEVLDFGHRGWLYEESFLFYDTKTDSLWVQATGTAIHGPFKGTHLKRLSATQTTFGQWRRLQPDTLVLGQKPAEKLRYAQDSYETYYQTGGGIRHKKAGPLTIGLAVLAGQKQKLYPFPELEKKGFVNDRLGKVPVLVVLHAASRTAMAFERRHAGMELEFASAEGKENDVLLKDLSTGSIWSGMKGQCLRGPAKGARLPRLHSTQFVQENWRLHYAEGAVYKPVGKS
jgi:hypothetical protein